MAEKSMAEKFRHLSLPTNQLPPFFCQQMQATAARKRWVRSEVAVRTLVRTAGPPGASGPAEAGRSQTVGSPARPPPCKAAAGLRHAEAFLRQHQESASAAQAGGGPPAFRTSALTALPKPHAPFCFVFESGLNYNCGREPDRS